MVVKVPESESPATPVFPNHPVILFFGAPLSGVEIYTSDLSSRLGLPVFQTKKLLRAEAPSENELRKLPETSDLEMFLSENLAENFITKALSSAIYDSGFIIDNYPRNIDGLECLHSALKRMDLEIDAIIYLEADYGSVLEKIKIEKICYCQSCNTFVPFSLELGHCCSNPTLIQGNDAADRFGVIFREYQDQTTELLQRLSVEYADKYIHINSSALSSSSDYEISAIILQELTALPFRRMRPFNSQAFDDPFEWLLKFVKSKKNIEIDDLKFYLKWALDCNRPDQSGLLRRIVFIATTSKPKFLEYRKTFLLYGIEVIRVPVFDNEEVVKLLLSGLEEPNFSAVALLSDSSNLYKPTYVSATIEDIESNRLKLCSMKNGVHCSNYCILSVTYSVITNDGFFDLKSYKILDRVDGTIKTDCIDVPSFAKVFGWDNIFYVKGLDRSYQYLREAGFKNSARDRVLSQFLRRHVHYKTTRNLQFHSVPVKTSIDFSINISEFFQNIQEYNLDLVREYGFSRIWKRMLHSGIFFRAAAFRRIGIYWNPGVNGGLPLVKKADHIHEITFMAHDIGHQVLPDLVFSGRNSFIHKRTYIMWRMMSEAFTMALTDMIFIDALRASGVQYDFCKRKIYPLFLDLNVDVSPRTNVNRMECIRKVVHANFVYCINGDDSEYRNLISSNPSLANSEKAFENLEAFKTKYAPFFVEDFRWTEQNYNSMVSTRSIEARKWWESVQDINNLLGDFKIKSIDDFLGQGVDINTSSDSLIEHIFSVAFDSIVCPLLESSEEKFDLLPGDEEKRKFLAFTRWMIGQLSICFKFDFIPESSELFKKISGALTRLGGRINDEEIVQLRSVYESYLDKLVSLSLISYDDHATFSQVYPLFDPFFVNYDKNITEYESLTSISKRILDDRKHHYSFYHSQASRIIGRRLKDSEIHYLTTFYTLIEKSGGIISNGLFVVEPGVLLLAENNIKSPDSTVSILISGISVETSLEFIAHHETKVARLTSSKTKSMNLPLFEINNYDRNMMLLIESSLKSREYFELDYDKNFENINLTLPAAKATVASFTVSLKDMHSILIGRLGNPKGNEKSVIKVATKIAVMLNKKYPEIIHDLDFYMQAKNYEKYVAASPNHKVTLPGETRILPEAWELFHAFNIPCPTEGSPSTASLICIAEFNARLTYLSFSKSLKSFGDSINFVKNIVIKEGHASILASFQVVHEGQSKTTKQLFTQFGWDIGLDPLISRSLLN